jgi:type I restriction enzyme M protein
LIRAFEIVREQILADADRKYSDFKNKISKGKKLSKEEQAALLREKFDAIQVTLDQRIVDSRMWKLSNRCIYGTDANDRMARTSKMNMIMHGDGHGGVHHHDGFLNVNGIFEGRFDIILTNPPFGANVEPSDKITEEEITVSPSSSKRYTEEYGDLYTESQERVKAALNKPIASLFSLPKSPKAKIKTEILFIERCLDLLKPGGRMGVVLPEGIYNNPSLAYVREFTEDRAYLKAVVSLPQETFISSGANVKCSLLFLQKYSTEEKLKFDETDKTASAEIDVKYADEIATETERLEVAIAKAKEEIDTDGRKALQKELKEYLKQMDDTKTTESRQLLKQRFDYPIFMYEAEKVGITATGDEDQNELYPQPEQLEKAEKSCLEWYREFTADSKAFADAGGAE